ncbi:hypothetical protein BDY19DRAFT_556409 [Irpex rosettiformis]|uniref:Uncharacterized protein n=1 Tax=Irpex rosettiformis TaxID=378272 RepID=A0ACB8TQN1_9APHY|nr:hypothetical protein BDY19DRAFT_556409 [Irpex rosettiformis]
MAVLEGLVAVLELFDRLKETAQHKTDAVLIKAHVIHLAACQPDAAERPMWNVSPALDTVTWDSMPSEFRKREINYSLVQLRPISRLSDLYNSIAAIGSQEPWFKVRPGHSVRLMGYPAPPPKHGTGAKRAMDPTSSPDNKRQKVSSHPQPSPRVSHTVPQSLSNTPKLASSNVRRENTTPQMKPSTITSNTPLVIAPPPPPPPSQSQLLAQPPTVQLTPPPLTQTPQPPPAHTQPLSQSIIHTAPESSMAPNASQLPAAIAGLSPEKFQAFVERLNGTEKKMSQQARTAATAEAEGRHEEAKRIRENLDKTMVSLQKLKAVAASVSKFKMQQQQQQSSLHGPPPQPGNAVPSGSIPQSINASPQKERTASPTLQPLQPSVPAARPLTSSTLPHASPQRPAAQPHTQPPPVQQPGQAPAPSKMLPPQASPQMATQMQKLIEQRNRAAPHVPPTNTPGLSLAGQNVAPTLPHGGGVQGPLPHWRGLLTWSGSDSGTHVRRDMQASVAMLPNRNGEPIDFTTWPVSMAISPSRERAVTPAALQEWLKKYKCTLVSVNPLPQTLETKAVNEESFKTLFRLLNEKGIYAVAAWNTMNGPMENRILIFPAKMQLFAAFFPTQGGMPELPKPPVDPSQNPQMVKIREIFSRLTREQQINLMAQPPEKRIAWIQSMAMRSQQTHLLQQQQMQQQKLQQSQQSSAPQFPPQQSLAVANMQPIASGSSAFQHQIGNPSVLSGFSGIMQSQQPQQIPPGTQIMNYGAMGMPSSAQSGMHQRTPSGNSMMSMGLPPGVTAEMMQSFLGNRNGG